ncbi:MAG TPA: class I SAM-dependent methyltransferase [Rhizomicrobium sp.]|nr:class I SAM-dependent methyltransferase [Rhizomicrobium sp.]
MTAPQPDRHGFAASMSIEQWIALVLSSADEWGADPRVPRLPPVAIQKLTNNRDGRKTLEGAAKLYGFVAREVRARAPSAKDLRLLDFGCGWGRFARFFPQLTPEANIFGIDADARLIAACREYLPGMNFAATKPRRPLPFAEGTFDVVFSNSVFSHLNEKSHCFYIAEIARCTKPGGLLIATTLGPSRLRRMNQSGKGWLGSMARKMKTAEDRIEAGHLAFQRISCLPTAFFRDYGLAFVPDGWTKTHWAPFFDVIEVRTDFAQDVNVALRRN